MDRPFTNSSTHRFTTEEIDRDPGLIAEMKRLHHMTVWSRWLVVIFLWFTIGVWSLWGLRSALSLWLEYFTWAAVKYGLAYHRWSTLGLGICVGATLAVLMWQSRNILLGLPAREQDRLAQRVLWIRSQGRTHPLWHWVCRK